MKGLRFFARGRARPFIYGLLISLTLLAVAHSAVGQSRKPSIAKLPSAEKIVEKYLKAIGGKKRVMSITDATYEWVIQLKSQTMGTARSLVKPPASVKLEMTFGNGQIVTATSASSAWSSGLGGESHTLTGAEANVAKLQGLLDASRLVDYKKSAVLARTVTVDERASEPTYVVEFSARNGARLRYAFGIRTNLLLQVSDDVRKTSTRFEDYRTEHGLLEPHRITLNVGGDLTLLLQKVSYNTGVSVAAFDPPRAAETLDVPALLIQVGKNQDEVEKRVSEYAFIQKETDREITSKGETKKETVKVYEIFPIVNREPIQKLISENDVPLSPERAAKEEKRVQEEFERAERDREKDAQKAARRRAENSRKKSGEAESDEGDAQISQFLKACEFVSPRREKFGERDAIVFDFRPRPGFQPSNRTESLISKLIGAVWIDPLDRQVMRLEARLAEGFKMAGGLLLSLRPGAALVMEQTRMAEGVWLPRFAQINLSVKVLLFGGGDYNKTIEWSDYRHFQGDVGGYKLDTPKVETKKPE